MKAIYIIETNKAMKGLATAFFPATFLLLFSLLGFGQTNLPEATDKWMRVASDDGEFSVEVPETYHYFYSKDGFSVSTNGRGDKHGLKEARILKSFVNGTIISFECYQGDKGAFDAMLDSVAFPKAKVVRSEIKRANFSIKQMIRTTDNYYLITQYLYSKKNIYVLTTASRGGETALMRRFLDSLIFSPEVSSGTRKDVKLSSLLASEPEVEFDLTYVYPPAKPATKTNSPKNPDDRPFSLLYKPYPSFTDAAERYNVTGLVVIKATCSAEGNISKIVVLRQLSSGLLGRFCLRQCD